MIRSRVSLYGLQQEILWAIDRCEACSPDGNVELTSGRGGKHSRASLHYLGMAVDIMTKHLTQEVIRLWVKEIKARLGKAYDVIYHANHIHIEYQPKDAHEYPM